MYIILAILLLAILIVVHEFGHFMAARVMKIDVREFAVGFGPKLIGWKSRKYETTFAIRLIPMGGYCSFYGEDDATGISKDDPRNFGKHNVWKRMFVILMGPMMNFVLAFVVGTVMLWCSGVTVATEPAQYDPFIQEVLASGPAHDAGLKSGDEVLEINGKNMMDGTMETLLGTISAWKEGDAPLNMTIRRNGETVQASVTPAWNEEAKKMQIGVYIGGYLRTETKPVGFFEGFAESGKMCVNAGGAILRALKNLVTKGEGLDDTAGPVGIVSMISSQVEGQAAAGADFHQPGPDESAADSRTGRKPADIRHHRSDPRKTGSAAEGSDRAPDRHGAAPAADGFLHVQGRYEAFPVKRSGI